MINYYIRPDQAHVKVDTETKTVVNVLNIPIQKTISQISSEEYYTRMTPEFEKYTQCDEQTYLAAFEAARAAITGM